MGSARPRPPGAAGFGEGAGVEGRESLALFTPCLLTPFPTSPTGAGPAGWAVGGWGRCGEGGGKRCGALSDNGVASRSSLPDSRGKSLPGSTVLPSRGEPPPPPRSRVAPNFTHRPSGFPGGESRPGTPPPPPRKVRVLLQTLLRSCAPLPPSPGQAQWFPDPPACDPQCPRSLASTQRSCDHFITLWGVSVYGGSTSAKSSAEEDPRAEGRTGPPPGGPPTPGHHRGPTGPVGARLASLRDQLNRRGQGIGL